MMMSQSSLEELFEAAAGEFIRVKELLKQIEADPSLILTKLSQSVKGVRVLPYAFDMLADSQAFFGEEVRVQDAQKYILSLVCDYLQGMDAEINVKFNGLNYPA